MRSELCSESFCSRDNTICKSPSPEFQGFMQIPQSQPNPPAFKPSATQENRDPRWKKSSPYMLSVLTTLPMTSLARESRCPDDRREMAPRGIRQRVPRFCHHRELQSGRVCRFLPAPIRCEGPRRPSCSSAVRNPPSPLRSCR